MKANRLLLALVAVLVAAVGYLGWYVKTMPCCRHERAASKVAVSGSFYECPYALAKKRPVQVASDHLGARIIPVCHGPGPCPAPNCRSGCNDDPNTCGYNGCTCGISE